MTNKKYWKDNMKKGLYLTIVLVVMAVLAGCKNELQQVSGEYSYKISGNAIVDSTEVHLTNESGALHIIDKDEKELLLTFNMLAGDVYTTNAELSAKVLKINEFERVIMHNAKNYKIKVTGEGNVYDNNIVLDMQYKGMSMDKDSIELESKDIKLVATRN